MKVLIVSMGMKEIMFLKIKILRLSMNLKNLKQFNFRMMFIPKALLNNFYKKTSETKADIRAFKNSLVSYNAQLN